MCIKFSVVSEFVGENREQNKAVKLYGKKPNSILLLRETMFSLAKAHRCGSGMVLLTTCAGWL